MKTAAVALAALLLAPVAARADTGQRLEITTTSDVQAPDAQAILQSLLGEPGGEGKREVQVRVMKQDGSTTLRIDVVGATLPADSADRLRAMFPALKNAQIALVATSGRSGVAGISVGAGELDTPEKIAAFKERMQKKLAAEGKTGTVDVVVTTGADGKKQVRIEVKAEK